MPLEAAELVNDAEVEVQNFIEEIDTNLQAEANITARFKQFSDSKILCEKAQENLCQKFEKLKKAELLVRGSEDDGFNCFASKLQDKDRLLFVIKPEIEENICGAYLEPCWTNKNVGWNGDITHKPGQSFIFKVLPEDGTIERFRNLKGNRQVFRSTKGQLCQIGGDEFFIGCDCNSKASSSAALGINDYYEKPADLTEKECLTYLAGQEEFRVIDFEVFQLSFDA